MEDNKRVPALLLKMKAFYPSLSKSEQQVIDYITKNPEKVIYLSVAGLAENSGVSDATVIRTCRSIGLNGYQELKVTLAQDIVSPLQSIHEEINSDDTPSVIIDKVFQGTLHAINFTHDILKSENIEKAVEAILNANRVIIIGLGNSHAIALDLQHKLLRLGIDAIALSDSHLQAITSTCASSKDVVFAISHSGSSRDIVENAQLAKDNGSTIISLTNIGSSPLTEIADIKLYTASRETHYRILALNSRIVQMIIIDCIYTIIATMKPNAIENFYKIEQAMNTKKF